jgi:DNA polymerase
MTKSARLSDLATMAQGCTQCDLRTPGKGFVFGEGNAESSVVFVSEETFSQRTSDPFTQMLEEAGFLIQDVYMTNIVKCSCGRTPRPSERQTCLPWLRKQYSILKPAVMVLLGQGAAQAILDKDIQISECRGQWFQRGNTTMMPTFHPGYVLRRPLQREIFVDDLRWVKRVCEGLSMCEPA